MKTQGWVLVTCVLAAGCLSDGSVAPDAADAADLAPLYLAARDQGVPNQYLVMLRPDAVTSTSALAATAGAQPARHFHRVRRGFVAQLTPGQVTTLRRSVAVAWIEQDQIVRTAHTQIVSGAARPWGLDRIDQAALPYSETYEYNRLAPDVTAYVLDTGIRTGHPDFKLNGVTRAANVFNAFGASTNDCNGHGTHVAGIIGSRTYGVAKRIQLRGLTVLDCDGNGTTSTVVAGLDWLLANFQPPAVANLSLSAIGVSRTMNMFVDSVARAGVLMVVAAGNDDDYSCLASPASAIEAISVAASDSLDARATFTNWGRCVDLYAPGVAIPSTYIPDVVAIASGTSQASPHVAGVAALLKQRFGDLTTDGLRTRLHNWAVPDVITNNDPFFYHYGTPNRLLQKRKL